MSDFVAVTLLLFTVQESYWLIFVKTATKIIGPVRSESDHHVRDFEGIRATLRVAELEPISPAAFPRSDWTAVDIGALLVPRPGEFGLVSVGQGICLAYKETRR